MIKRSFPSLSALIGTVSLVLTACAPVTRVTQVAPDVYEIRKEGGWGYDLKSLRQELQDQAKTFAQASGRDYEILSTEVRPDERVDVYPADDDTEILTFRLLTPIASSGVSNARPPSVSKGQ